MKTLIYIFVFITSLSFSQNEIINKLIEEKIDHSAVNPVHSILLYAENDSINYNEGFGRIDIEKDSVSKHSSFRIASSTKLFVATIILQLEEGKKLSIKDKVAQYLKDIGYLNFDEFHNFNGKNYASTITIEQLLSHRSGLADIFVDKEEAFFNLVMQNPEKQYSTKAIIDLYHEFNLNKAPHFKPNNGWKYSDINYVLLGLLIETLDKTSLSTAIRNRILKPLKMDDTYFEFYEPSIQKNKVIQQYVGNTNFSSINTSFDWAGGGLVSTNRDLALFIKALFNLELINQDSLNKMIDVKFTKENESRYGLGVYEFIINEHVFYGHFGFYGTFVGYSPKTKTTLSYSISQATPNFNSYQFISKMVKFFKLHH